MQCGIPNFDTFCVDRRAITNPHARDAFSRISGRFTSFSHFTPDYTMPRLILLTHGCGRPINMYKGFLSTFKLVDVQNFKEPTIVLFYFSGALETTARPSYILLHQALVIVATRSPVFESFGVLPYTLVSVPVEAAHRSRYLTRANSAIMSVLRR